MKALDALIAAGTDPDVVELYHSLPERAAAGTGLLVEDELVVMDTETTGVDSERDALIEISACVLRGAEVLDTFDTFVDPRRPIPAEIVALTGITQGDVEDSPDPGAAVGQFAAFAAGRPIVAHNARFDRGFVMRQAQGGSISEEWMDSLALANIVLPRLKSHKLPDLARAFGLEGATHRADDDVAALAALWPILVAGVYALPAGMAGFIAGISPETSWPLRRVFQQAAGAESGLDFNLKGFRTSRIKESAAPERPDAEDMPLSFPSAGELDRAFTREGLVGAMYPGFEPRQAQVDMAGEVLGAFREGHCAVLEAGTGVGKSMAYLVPAALVAKRNSIRIGVATKTNALTDQLMYHELPELARAMGDLDYISLKGYDHYMCLRK